VILPGHDHAAASSVQVTGLRWSPAAVQTGLPSAAQPGASAPVPVTREA